MYELDQKILFADLLNEIFLDYLDSIENKGYIILINDHIQYVNKYFIELTGYQKEVMTGSPIKNFIPDYYLDESIKSIEQVNYRDENQIISFKCSDGNTILLNIKGKIFRQEDKKVVFLMIKIMTLVFDNPDMELYQSILNTISENIFIIDKELTIIKTIKIKSEKYNTNNSLSDYFTQTALKQISKNTEKKWINKDVRSFEIQNNKKYFEGKLVPFKTNYFVFAFSEISLRKRIENKLIDSQIQLRETNKEKDLLLSIIAHDLKNPFNVINGFCSVLLNTGKHFPAPKKDEIIGHIYTASFAGHNLLENLLEWSRAQSERIIFSPEIIGLKEISSHIIHFYSVNIANKKLNVENKISNDIFVYADKNMLSTVLRNLISNAIKFSNEKGIMVLNAARDEDNFTRISVKDSGIGLSEKQLNDLFKVGRNNSTRGTQGEKGTGLGLLLCKEFVEKHKGNIQVQSVKNEGSEFIFTIPSISPVNNNPT